MSNVLAVRVNEETQAKFKDFAESGDFRNQGDFLAHLVTLYAAQETSLRIPTLEGAINTVNELTDRIIKVLIGTGEVIITNQEKEKAQIEIRQLETAKKINAVSEVNENLKTEILNLQLILNNTKKELSEMQAKEKKLNQTLDDKAALIDEYRIKIDNLESEINRQRVIVSDAIDSRNELENLRIAVNELNVQMKNQKLEKEKTTLELETKLRKEMIEQQTAYSKSINSYESKVYTLLKEIENLKNKI